jgi:hypothetical protein
LPAFQRIGSQVRDIRFQAEKPLWVWFLGKQIQLKQAAGCQQYVFNHGGR